MLDSAFQAQAVDQELKELEDSQPSTDDMLKFVREAAKERVLASVAKKVKLVTEQLIIFTNNSKCTEVAKC